VSQDDEHKVGEVNAAKLLKDESTAGGRLQYDGVPDEDGILQSDD
jgi:hypothetical protein